MEADNKQPNILVSRYQTQLPGEVYRLPSNGTFYQKGDGILDDSVSDAEVHVHPMTTIDEIMFKTPSMLFSGDAVRETFRNCIPEVLDVDRMLARDVDFLMLCLKVVSYGPELEIYERHDCENAEDHSYIIDISQFISNVKRIDPTTTESVFTVNMKNGQVVKLQPITFKDFITFMHMLDDEKTISTEEKRDRILQPLSNMIISVDEITDKQQIFEWLTVLSPKDIKSINDVVDKTLEWGPDMTTTVKCRDCNKEFEVKVPVNPMVFFT